MPFPIDPRPAAAGADVRCLGAAGLSLALIDARNRTLRLLAAFDDAGMDAAARPGSPLWLAGHAAWLSEAWIARNPQRSLGPRCPAGAVRLASIEPGADRWFDPRLAQRGAAADAPDGEAVRAYLLATLETTLELLENAQGDDDALHFFRLAVLHEDLRSAQLCEIAQASGVPVPVPLPAAMRPREPLFVPATRWTLGADEPGFSFGIDVGPHEVAVPEFEIDAQPVTWAQFAEFAADGGYDRRECWDDEGWAWLAAAALAEGRRGPRYVEQIGAGAGAVLRQVFGRPARMAGPQPVLHVTAWEAGAYARWAGRRLPTEVEWEIAASRAAGQGFRWGEVREWMAGRLRAWPGGRTDACFEGSDLDPGPAIGRARVQRGASFADSPRLRYVRRRSFALPDRDDAFVGFRTCAA